jgi:hypothetical protein
VALRDALTVFQIVLDESSKAILKKTPIYLFLISSIFFHLYRAENGDGGYVIRGAS